MTTMRFAAAAVAAAGVLASAGPAAAAIMLARYEGVVQSGYATRGAFGPSIGLAGARYVATFTFDSERSAFWGRLSNHDRPDDWYDGVAGYLGDSPILAFSMSINGHTDVATFGPDVSWSSGRQYTEHSWNGDLLGSFMQADDSSSSFRANAILDATTAAPRLLTESWSGDSDPTGLSEGTFSRGTGSFAYYVSGKPTRLTVSGVVPEPATWALMILGFGAAGAMLRRSRRMRAAA
jgi:hypothetical protein